LAKYAFICTNIFKLCTQNMHNVKIFTDQHLKSTMQIANLKLSLLKLYFDQSVKRLIILYYSHPDRRCPWDTLVLMRAVYFSDRKSTCGGFLTSRGAYKYKYLITTFSGASLDSFFKGGGVNLFFQLIITLCVFFIGLGELMSILPTLFIFLMWLHNK